MLGIAALNPTYVLASRACAASDLTRPQSSRP